MTDPSADCCGLAAGDQACAVTRTPGPTACPGCGAKLRPVPAAHVARHVREAFRGRVPLDAAYGFCPDPGCGVVFAAAGGPAFGPGDLRHPPAYKSGSADDWLCYCFDVRGADALGPDAAAAVAYIRERVRAGDCACDVLNPSAGCCLGSIGAYQKSARGG